MFNLSSIMSSGLKTYIAQALNPDEQLWLSNVIIKDTGSLLKFALSNDGYTAIRAYFGAFKNFVDKGPKETPAKAHWTKVDGVWKELGKEDPVKSLS